MAITYSDAITAREFHYGPVADTRARAKMGAVRCEVYRRNGSTQTWKTRPDEYRVPVKYGLKGYAQLLDTDGARVDGATGAQWWTASTCPVCHPELMAEVEAARAAHLAELAREREYWSEVDARYLAEHPALGAELAHLAHGSEVAEVDA